MTVLAAAVLALAPALQDRKLSMDGEAGFTGAAFADSWTRLVATLRNEGPQVQGELRMTLRGRAMESVVYRQPILLPVKARMRFWRDAYLTGAEEAVDFELVDKQGKTLRKSSVPIRYASEAERRTLVVGAPPSWLWKGGGGLATAPTVAPEFFPTDARALLGADTILVAEPFELQPGQEEALRQWIALGGRLVFSTGKTPLFRQDRFWKELCPIESVETRSFAVRELSIPIALGTPRRGESFLGLAGQPAGYRASHGAGRVVFLAFPLDTPRFDEVQPPEAFWRSVLELPPRKDEEDLLKGRTRAPTLVFTQADDVMLRLLPREIHLSLPAFGWGALGLLAYVLLIGPVGYRRLKQRNRLSRGWRPFGAIVAAFSGFSLLWGGCSPRPTQLSHLVFHDGDLVQAFTALRAGDSRTYELEADGLASPLSAFRSFAEGEGEPSVVDPPARLRVPAPALAARTMVSCRLPAEGEKTVACRWTEGTPRKLEVANGLEAPLREALLVTKDEVWRLGEVEAGAKREFSPADRVALPFDAWARGLEEKPLNPWMRQPPSLDRYARDRHGLVLTFYEAILRETEKDVKFRMRPRHVDLTSQLDRGAAVFVAAADADLSGVRAAGGPRVDARVLVRRIVQ